MSGRRAPCYDARIMLDTASTPRNPTRAVPIGSIVIGAGHPIAVQSMTATKTADVDATAGQIEDLERAGADVVRIAVDSARRDSLCREVVSVLERRIESDAGPRPDRGGLLLLRGPESG